MESGRAALALEELLAEELRAGGILHIDETTWRESGVLLWLWVVFTSDTTVVYWIASRSAELLETVLGDSYDGWLMSDGYAVYRQFLKRCRCWAHLLRKAQGLVECLDPQAQRFGRQTLDLLDILIAAIRTYLCRVI
jgi:transposase